MGSLRLQNPVTVVTGFDRPNLFFRVVTRKGGKETDNSVLNYVKKHEDESGIIYCATKKNADKIYGLLQQYDIEAGHYHAGLSLEERKKNQDDFTYDRIRVMVATNAFGMGIDKSNVRYVLHYNMPQSLEYYYQEAGRAGRDGEEAECVLFFSKQDIMINKRLLEYKSTESIESDPQVRRNDYQKLNRMIDYCETQQCLRQFILSYFGDNSPCTCDKCSNCVVVEDEEEENYIQTKKEKKKAFQLANLTPKGQELFEQLRKCRTELAAEKGVPPYIICSDKTLTDMCAKCPADNEDMETVYGMGVQKIQSYGEHFTKIIIDFLEEQSAAGGADAETLQLTTELTPEQIEETTGITVAASPARKKKLPFYIAPGKLDEVELTDTCMISELTNRINELCDEEDQKNRKKLTAAFVNTLLIQKGYIEEATEGEEKVKHMSCLLGIKTHTALSMIVEVGDFERFEKAPKFASFLGLVPSEDSSDTRVNRYSITKAGNSHLRKLLVEVAQSYTRGNVGHKSVALKQRQKGNPPEVIAYADKANERLRRRFYKMTLNKGVSRDVAATAIARELACFIWGMMTEAGKVSVRGKAMAKKFVRYKEGAELYSMVQTSQQNTIQLKNRFQKSQSRVMWQSLRAWVTELQALYHLKRVHSFRLILQVQALTTRQRQLKETFLQQT